MALSGARHMPAKCEDGQKAARVFYVAATRATHRLVVGMSGCGGFVKALANVKGARSVITC